MSFAGLVPEILRVANTNSSPAAVEGWCTSLRLGRLSPKGNACGLPAFTPHPRHVYAPHQRYFRHMPGALGA
jgi:hypothetical protein